MRRGIACVRAIENCQASIQSGQALIDLMRAEIWGPSDAILISSGIRLLFFHWETV